MQANQAANYLATDNSPSLAGNSHPSIAPYDVVYASDKPFVIGMYTLLKYHIFIPNQPLAMISNFRDYAQC